MVRYIPFLCWVISMEICWILAILTDIHGPILIFAGFAFGIIGISVGLYIRDSYFKNGDDK